MEMAAQKKKKKTKNKKQSTKKKTTTTTNNSTHTHTQSLSTIAAIHPAYLFALFGVASVANSSTEQVVFGPKTSEPHRS
jgi:hypothetical protein